jgi:3-oxoadipate enol-lactonase
MPTFDRDGLSLHFERGGLDALPGTGSPPRLLCISGTGAELRSKPSVFDGPLASHFDLLAYDQRGLGRSSVPDGPYSMADYGADAAALLASVGWESCLVMGVSFGGMVAQELAIRHPNRVQRLVLACTSSGGRGGSSCPLGDLVHLQGAERVERFIGLMDTRWDDARRASHADEWQAMVTAMSAYIIRPDSGPDGGPDSGPGGGPNGGQTRAIGAALQLDARSRHDTATRLHEIACPTLVCAGRYDGIAPLANSEFLAAQIPGATLAVFEGGHQFLWQDRTAFPRIIEYLSAGPVPAGPPPTVPL